MRTTSYPAVAATGWRPALALSVLPLLWMSAAWAMDIETGNPDLKLRWDNSVKYSAAVRVRDPSAVLMSDPNQDDGDRDFRKKGLVSNRIDLLSDLDLVYQDAFGLRVSGAAWYDTVYNRHNENDSPRASPNAGRASHGPVASRRRARSC